jgi:SAM-dependent methyltransferase
MSLKEQMDDIYQNLSLVDIPWNLEKPPHLLVELVESGRVLPCRVADLGCGAGNYAVWLATRGFQVTAIDISANAVELARTLAQKTGVSCRFVTADLTGDAEELVASFDFVYDWEVLHHVFPENRHRYVTNVHQMLRRGGRYLSVCFSEDDDPSFGGGGKYRETPLGTRLYFSSEEELRDLFQPLFEIEELATIEVPGKRRPHLAIKSLMTKKE